MLSNSDLFVYKRETATVCSLSRVGLISAELISDVNLVEPPDDVSALPFWCLQRKQKSNVKKTKVFSSYTSAVHKADLCMLVGQRSFFLTGFLVN